MKPKMAHAVYILSKRKRGTLYVGATRDLRRRVWEHKQGLGGFAPRYGVHRPVYYEIYEDADAALLRERQLKRRRRSWKVELIEQTNPQWEDPFSALI